MTKVMKVFEDEALKLALTIVKEFLSRSPNPNTSETTYSQASSQTSITMQE
jgi:hypothetical protein